MTNVKHNLKHNGAPYNESGELINPDPKVTSGRGRALCTCGWLSVEVDNGAQRRAWHKDHKALRTEAPVQTELVLGQDVLAGTPEDEVAEALAELVAPAPAPKAKSVGRPGPASLGALLNPTGPRTVAPKAKRAPKAKQDAPAPADDANTTTLVVPFTTEVTAGFWRSLGRDAAKALVDNHYPTVTGKADNNARTLTLQGPSEDVPAAAEAIEAMWADALLAVKEWKKTDPAFLGRSTEPLARRQEGYHLTEAFFVQFGASYGA